MIETYPSPNRRHRFADLIVHIAGLLFVLIAGTALILRASELPGKAALIAVVLYLLCVLASNLASCAYHFAPLHTHRPRLRRLDHAVIYFTICGTFTPIFVMSGSGFTLVLLGLLWVLAIVAFSHKCLGQNVKSRWSTASYLGFGALGMMAIPSLQDVPDQTIWWVVTGALSYAVGTIFYAQKRLPYRYAIWHSFVAFGGVSMLCGIWILVGAQQL
jgi:hemolysin III